MNLKWDRLVTGTLIACTLITTGLVLHRELFATSATAGRAAVQAPVFVRDWMTHMADGVYLGPTSAQVKLIEFADFECPYCGDLHKTLKALEDKYPRRIALTYVYFPIPGHRIAMPAARVAECANDQGRFEAMHNALFEGQDQLGLKPWDDYASTAGVPDMAAFDACIKKTDLIPRVEQGKALGAKLDVQGTPTIIINGWKLGRPPTEAELDQMVQRILTGKSPIDGKS
jgi:protein-disulfide isomerase